MDHRVVRADRGAGVAAHGRALQVEPMTPVLKVPGTKRLKLTSDEQLSSVAIKFNLRR